MTEELGFLLLKTEDIGQHPTRIGQLNNIAQGLSDATIKVVRNGVTRWAYSSNYPYATFTKEYPKIDRGFSCYCVLNYGRLEYTEQA
jgi:hypothetical protein